MRLTFSLFASLILLFPVFSLAQTTDEVFPVVEQMPRFPGCEELDLKESEKQSCAEKLMLDYIYSNIKYPTIAIEQKIDGMVIISFVVDKTGEITSTKVVKAIGGGCDEEALRVVNSFPNFTPGMQEGKAVKVSFNLPIRFKLKEEREIPTTVFEEVTPELYNSIRQEYSGLQSLFCLDFVGEFIPAQLIFNVAESEVNADNLCGFFFQMRQLKMDYTEAENTKSLSSENGQVTQEMREMLKGVKAGGTLVFDYEVSRDDQKVEVNKTIVVQ